ncbi:hypothetical protein [Pyrococcus yayanosii]|uniref:Uncharacterized protein n=1 Tax=Pyrococcus yayanosii (strain CH1 / JCM 16557) TaxID=529709 RepID=F8AEQ1_PYRYC|nr:hypothetical protein [Pyrococcus yayanosii]AEH24733.1 hypothetical protein PYCH_10520 [Pyrococcus yayanosii CH1]
MRSKSAALLIVAMILSATVVYADERESAEALLKVLERAISVAKMFDVDGNVKAAEELRDRATDMLDAGKYLEAKNLSVMGLRAVESSLRQVEVRDESQMDLAGEINRGLKYLSYVNLTLTYLEKRGYNTSALREAYLNTLSLYLQARNELRVENVQAAKKTLEKAESEKRMLESALISMFLTFRQRNARHVVEDFLNKSGFLLKYAELTALSAEDVGIEVNEIRHEVEEVRALRERVKRLVEEGKWLEALQLIDESSPLLLKLQAEASRLQAAYVFRQASENPRSFLGRLQVKANQYRGILEDMSRSGIDVSRPMEALTFAEKNIEVASLSLSMGREREALLYMVNALRALNYVGRFISMAGGGSE